MSVDTGRSYNGIPEPERWPPVSADGTEQRVVWADGCDLSALRDTPIRFRFHVTGGSLYAFWVSPDATGASNGYVAAGGPNVDASANP